MKSSPLGISYTRASEILKQGLWLFVEDGFNLGTHSPKSGAAIAVAKGGVDPSAIDKHAGWRSKKSQFRYVSDSLTKKLSVSGALGK